MKNCGNVGATESRLWELLVIL